MRLNLLDKKHSCQTVDNQQAGVLAGWGGAAIAISHQVDCFLHLHVISPLPLPVSNSNPSAGKLLLRHYTTCHITLDNRGWQVANYV